MINKQCMHVILILRFQRNISLKITEILLSFGLFKNGD